MPGWFSRASAFASRVNRSAKAESSPLRGGRILRATRRSNCFRSKLVEGDDARMVQPGQRLRLASKPFGKGGVITTARRQDFEGDEAVKLLLPGLIDRAHAATSQQFEDFEAREVPGHLLDG